MNIALYGECDKRAIVFGLFKILQDFGSVMFITQERHYKRLINSYEYGSFQDVFICVTDESPDNIFRVLHKNPNEFDYIIWDTNDWIPDDIDLTYVCSCYVDEFALDEVSEMYPNPFYVKFMFDGKRDTGVHNVKISVSLIKYIELAEAYKILDKYNFPELSKVFEDSLSERLGVKPKIIKGILGKEWER